MVIALKGNDAPDETADPGQHFAGVVHIRDKTISMLIDGFDPTMAFFPFQTMGGRSLSGL